MGAVILTVILLALAAAGAVSAILASKKIKASKAAMEKPLPPVESQSGRWRGESASLSDATEAALTSKKKYASVIQLQNLVRWVSIGVSGVAIIALALMCTTTVSAKNVGVAVNFGAVSEQTLSPGIKLKLPWTQVVEIDGTIQTDQYEGEGACIPVRIGDGSQACADIVNRWQVNPRNAASIYEQHRSDDPTQSFRAAVVSTELKQSVQEALKNYNPIAELKAVGGDELATDLSFAPDYGAISQAIEEDMKTRLSRTGQAEVVGITFAYLKLSENTQRKLDDYVAAIGETRIATQQEETAKAQARANRELSASVSNDPNVLVSRCIDLVKDATQNGYQFPAGFSCWPGGGSAVVVPGTSNGNANNG